MQASGNSGLETTILKIKEAQGFLPDGMPGHTVPSTERNIYQHTLKVTTTLASANTPE